MKCTIIFNRNLYDDEIEKISSLFRIQKIPETSEGFLSLPSRFSINNRFEISEKTDKALYELILKKFLEHLGEKYTTVELLRKNKDIRVVNTTYKNVAELSDTDVLFCIREMNVSLEFYKENDEQVIYVKSLRD